MKNPRKILSKHYDVDNRVDEKAIIQAMKEYAKEVAKQALINASLKAECIKYDGGIEEKNKHHYVGSVYIEVDNQSILNESNIPEL